MNSFLTKFVKVCPKTGRFRKFIVPKGFYKLLFPIIGLAALLWILFRVVPKPSRAEYPCVKAATPFASGFIVYLAVLAGSALVYLKTKKKIFLSPYFALVAAAISGFVIFNSNSSDIGLEPTNTMLVSNAPTGEGKGIFPGRVVWAYNPNATNEECVPTQVDHAWWMSENNDQDVIDDMVSKVIQSLTGNTNDKDSWEAIFKFHNNTRAKGSVNYKSGEKIFIKINNVSGWGGNFSTKDLSVSKNGSYGISETSPQVVLSVLRQLVNVVGVDQKDIYIGDPLRNTYKHQYDYWYAEFPDIHYMSHDDYTSIGREQFTASTTAKVIYSDKGTILRENVWDANRPGEDPVYDDYLYTIFEEAEYLINIPQLKGHKRAGMTMFAKNHFGSHTRSSAAHQHNGLVDPIEKNDGTSRREYGMYRIQVDLMGHKLLGGKSLFYLMDALWAADQEISFPKKFQMQPFNNDFTSSIFASLDPVAIESVGYDFLRTEFTDERNLAVGDGAGAYPQKPATDDYLHQASDTTLWAEGIKYDPEGDGTNLTCLGTHEHWDNAVDKQYSRNLGLETGIELVKIDNFTDVKEVSKTASNYNLGQNYPNPFNPSTKISYSIPTNSNVVIKVYDVTGKEVETIENSYRSAGTYLVTFDAKHLASGVYYYKLTADNYSASKKFVVLK